MRDQAPPLGSASHSLSASSRAATASSPPRAISTGSTNSSRTRRRTGTPITDYDAARGTLRKQVEWSKHVPGQRNPAKGMNALVDVVRGEGRATEHAGTLLL